MHRDKVASAHCGRLASANRLAFGARWPSRTRHVHRRHPRCVLRAKIDGERWRQLPPIPVERHEVVPADTENQE